MFQHHQLASPLKVKDINKNWEEKLSLLSGFTILASDAA